MSILNILAWIGKNPVAFGAIVVAVFVLFPLWISHRNSKAQRYAASQQPPVSTDIPDVSSFLYVASASSQIYHTRSCRLAQAIAPENRVYLRDHNHAAQCGLKPCKQCIGRVDF